MLFTNQIYLTDTNTFKDLSENKFGLDLVMKETNQRI